MPNYLVLERSFINNAIVEAGETVSYEGEAGSNLQALDAPPPSAPRTRKPKTDPVPDGAEDSAASPDPASLV